ncbi:MAG TPA: DUF4956 domain-containing protein [Phycisphaerales bacterium]|nr:DUF4956 domain-containing protein [Phycisphaerales bacterium]
MPEWLQQAVVVESPLSAGTMAVRLGTAAGFGAVIAVIYRLSHGRLARDARTLVGTLVLLTILLAMVTMVIGDSVARAFGLVGALSIVRFRTVVEDTRDTAFVIFAVVTGMAVGTGLAMVAAVGVPIVGAAAVVLSARGGGAAVTSGEDSHTLVVRMGAGQASAGLEGVLRQRSAGFRLTGVTTARQGAATDFTYLLRLADAGSAGTLVGELNTVAGVQSVDLRAGTRVDA